MLCLASGVIPENVIVFRPSFFVNFTLAEEKRTDLEKPCRLPKGKWPKRAPGAAQKRGKSRQS